MIYTTTGLIKELERMTDGDFITVTLDGKEYVIDSTQRVGNDCTTGHITLNVRENEACCCFR